LLQLKDKGDFEVSGSFFYASQEVRSSNNTRAVLPKETSSKSSVQIGYSPIKHLGIVGTYSSSNNDNMNQSDLRSQGKIWQAAIGGYCFLRSKNNPNPNKGFLIDTYIGYGTGGISTNYYSRGGLSELNFQQYFIQTGLYFKNTKYDIGLNFKKSFLNYYNTNIFFELTVDEILMVESVVENNPYNMNQLSMRVASGFEKGKIFFTLNQLFNFDDALMTQSPEATFGVHLDLNKLLIKNLKG